MQCRLENVLREFKPTSLKLILSIGFCDFELSGSNSSCQLGFAEEWELLFDPIEQITVLRPLRLARAHAAQPDCRIFPGSHSAKVLNGSECPRGGGRHAGVVGAQTLREQAHIF